MAEKIRPFFAPEQQLRSSPEAAAAFQTAARRITPDYEAAARNERAQGQISASLFKETLWPLNVARLYEQRTRDEIAGAAADARKMAANAVRFRVFGVNDTFGGPTETFSEDPTKDYVGHAQVSRGLGSLGRALSDGGYGLSSLSSSGAGAGTRQDIDPTTGLPYVQPDYTSINKAQDALRKYNYERVLLPAQEYYEKLIKQDAINGPNVEGPSPYAGTYGYSSVNPAVSQVNIDAPDSGGFFSGLRNYIASLGSGIPGDTGGL